jgi:hypothetical protein
MDLIDRANGRGGLFGTPLLEAYEAQLRAVVNMRKAVEDYRSGVVNFSVPSMPSPPPQPGGLDLDWLTASTGDLSAPFPDFEPERHATEGNIPGWNEHKGHDFVRRTDGGKGLMCITCERVLDAWDGDRWVEVVEEKGEEEE